MQPPRIPADDAARVFELHTFGLLDSQPDSGFDDISELTRRIAGTEIGIISLVDSERQWFKSCVGAPLGQQETPRDVSFCGHTILQREPLVIHDALLDPRFADNPLVQGEPHLRFYAGFPLITSTGFAIGSLCAISRQPHQLSEEQIDSLRRLASLTLQQLEHRRDASLLAFREKGSEPDRLLVSSEQLRSLASLISRDQLVQKLDLLFAMEINSTFSLLRCWFRDYERVNSTMGGLVAEQYIDEAARRLVAALPPTASVARFADSELVVLLPFVVDEGEVKTVAERILSFANHVYRIASQSLSMTLSVGIAISRENYTSSEAILSDTSLAVRMARKSNASSFRFINAESRVAAKETYRFESEFREALAARVMEPHFQPIVDLNSGLLVGFETLARWSRQGTCIMPSQFIPMANDCGLTGEIDLLIIEKALAAMFLLAQPIPQLPISLSMNLSGVLLEDDELRARLLTLLDDNPCPPGWTLQLELLEDMFQDASDQFISFLNALVQRRVRICIDDFGTGYSSLARLISLPIQGVKVDQTFVSRLSDSEDSPRTLLRTMLTMLNDLGLEIIAEGVETPQQRDWLIAHGAGKAQGYLFARPQSLSETIVNLQKLDYRPGAIPVERSRIKAARRRRLRSVLRLPFLDAWGERRGPRA
jgi:EAL domain-containing protein (putative c-di-GMP-specific phosphodiesterase class I)/GAF domain-containing protein